MAIEFRTAFSDSLAENAKRGATTTTGETQELQSTADFNSFAATIRKTAQAAANANLPHTRALPRRPWISERTLSLIDERAEARATRQYEQEIHLNKRIKQSVRADKDQWLQDLVADGTWMGVKALKQIYSNLAMVD